MRFPFSKRRGLLTLEFLLVFSFILIGFLIIFSLEEFVIMRMTEAFDVWRVARVSSIIGWNDTVHARVPGDLSIKPKQALSIYPIEKFGDVIADSLESAWNISFAKNSVSNLPNFGSVPVEVNIQYNSDILKNFLKIKSDVFYWKCPNMPEGLSEHQPRVFDNTQ